MNLMSASRRKLIRLAEYVAVSASVVGAIATFTTQQPAYAVAPLSLSAALSLLSRRQQSQHLDAIAANSAQQSNQLALNVQQINQRLDTFDQQGISRQQSTAALNQALSQQSSEAIATAQRIAAIQKDIDRQQQQLTDLTANRSADELAAKLKQTELEQSLAQVNTTLQSIQTVLSDLSMRTDAISDQQREYIARSQQQSETQQAAIAEQVSHSANRLESQITGLYSDFEGLSRDLNELMRQLQERVEQASSETAAKTEITQESDFSQVVPQLPTEDNFDLDINLGIDFGTGYTKVCFRDVARDQSEVVTFAEPTQDKLTLDETLMPTQLAILQDGTLLTGLTVAEWRSNSRPIQKNISYIKMRLAAIDFRKDSQEDDWRLEQISELDDDETVKSLCAYYLSSVIKRSQQWIIQNRPDLFTNQTVRWSVKLGVPVEHYDSDALTTFKEVLALAWLLNSSDIKTSDLTLNSLNQLVAHLRQWKADNIAEDGLDCDVTPEIAAAVWSFLNSRQAQEGFYTFFDIGDGTLDGAAFIFKQGDGNRQVDFYIGQVKPLGVSAFVEKAADELNCSTESIQRSLNAPANPADPHLQTQIQRSTTRRRIQKLVAKVVTDGLDKHHQIRQFSVKQDIGQNLKVFVGGGGGNTTFFPNAILATHGDFQHSNADIPPYQLRQIPTPDDLAINGLDQKDFNRFAIAYGLSIPKGEGPEINLPSYFETVESGAEIFTPEPNKYEDGKDLM